MYLHICIFRDAPVFSPFGTGSGMCFQSDPICVPDYFGQHVHMKQFVGIKTDVTWPDVLYSTNMFLATVSDKSVSYQGINHSGQKKRNT